MSSKMYEEYWKITLAFSDIHGMKFRDTLRLIVNFVDENDLFSKEYNESYYKKLQDIVYNYLHIDYASVRKGINQYVKLGFVLPFLNGYHPLTKSFLLADNDFDRTTIFSKILYEGAHFSSSITNGIDDNSINEINYFVNTLIRSGPLSHQDIIAIMNVDIHSNSRNFMTREEIELKKRYVQIIEFEKRKYNQISYLKGIIQKLSEISYNKKDDTFYFSEEGAVSSNEENKKRDPYLHKIYKSGLIKESENLYGIAQCFVEKLPYKSLVASHMKPFKISNYDEEYDSKNGLLLCQNVDAYFDKFDISFENDGTMLIGKGVHPKVAEHYKNMRVDKEILTPERLAFLEFHRKEFYSKNIA